MIFQFSNLLSDFGGQFGLWMGVSVITLIEFGILAAEVIMKISCFGLPLSKHQTPDLNERINMADGDAKILPKKGKRTTIRTGRTREKS